MRVSVEAVGASWRRGEDICRAFHKKNDGIIVRSYRVFFFVVLTNGVCFRL